MNIGQKIYELRTAKNLSQGELAQMLDVSRQSVSKWETGTSVPDLDKLIKLCDVFEVTLDELTERKTETNKKTDEENGEANSDSSFVGTTAVLVEKEKISTQKIVGFILLTVGLISFVSGFIFSAFLIFIGTFLAVCGIICICVKKHAWIAIVTTVIILIIVIALLASIFMARTHTTVVDADESVYSSTLIESESISF